MALADIRREYTLGGLRRRDLAPEPLSQFRAWFDQALGARGGGRLLKFFVNLYKAFLMLGGAQPADVNAMTLATVDADGVALAAIQGLNTKLESGKQKAEMRMEKLEAENAALKARLERLEQLLSQQLNQNEK